MAVEIFLKLDGITGSSRNYHHKGWSDLASWQWSLDHNGAAGTAATSQFDKITVIKPLGMESPEIMRAFAERRVIKSAEIHVVPQVGKRDAQQKYLAMQFEDLQVNAIMTGGKSEESIFNETVTLVFGKVKFDYHQYADAGPDGGAQALQSFTFGWDIATNTVWS